MKTILLLVSTLTVTLFATPAMRSFAQQPAGPILDQLKAKNFTVKTLGGKSVDLNTLLGEGKPVLIDFWATWCGPCRMVIPHLGEMHRKYGKDGLIVIGVNLDNPAAQGAVRNFAKRYRMDYQNIFAQHAVYQFFSGRAVARIPYTLLFGADGKLIWSLVGYSPQIGAALDGAIAKAMAAAPEKPAEPLTPEKQTEQVAPEKPAEQWTPEKSVEKTTLEKPVEQSALEKSAGQAPPETKTCTCNCPCSSAPLPENQPEQGAPNQYRGR